MRKKYTLLVGLGLMLAAASIAYIWHSNKSEDPEWDVSHVTVSETTMGGLTLSEQTYTVDDLRANVDNFVKTPQGGIAWSTFAETKEIPYKFKGVDDSEGEGLKPEFSPSIKALDGKDVTVQGYMFPLGQDEKQTEFLLGPFPVSCPFHYHVSASMVIEVHPRAPMVFSYDPITIKGRLELVSRDDEFNVFYRLKDAYKMK